MPIDLHLVSWNLYGAPLAPAPEPRMHAVASWIAATAPDLVLFQEVWTEEQTRTIERVLDSTYELFESAPTRAVVGRKGGLVALLRKEPRSAWDVAEHAFIEFENEAPDWLLWQGDGIADKGIQRLELVHRESSLPLVVLNTHFQSPYGPTTLFEFESVREAQLAELAKAADSAAGPVVAAGDLNLGVGSENYQRLLATWNDLTVDERKRCGDCDTHDGEVGGRADWIDFVLGRDSHSWALSSSVRRLDRSAPDGSMLSDHNGLEAHIQFRATAQSRIPMRALAPMALLVPSTRRQWLQAAAFSVGSWMLPPGISK